ncbi:MAG: hypothetical protein KDK23_14110 [Leptospiraceae bacterium]|nr:hypothetical protein [Leptospiraceae bacterium]
MNPKLFSSLSTRTSFNKVLRHMVSVSGLIESIDKGANLADHLNGMLEEGQIEKHQVGAIVNVILNSRLKLPYKSKNMEESVSSFLPITTSFSRWNGVSLTMVYYHPTLGQLLVNPANEEHWASVQELKRDELIVVYARSRDGKRETAEKAIDAFYSLLAGKVPEEAAGFVDTSAPEPKPEPKPEPAAAQQAAPQAAQKAPPPAGKRNITPKYSVQVTNELFHNGNVEAWKNIIESYETKHGGNKVIVYHEGELIQDLNALFKWGKVKHGGIIMFQVAGTAIKGVSRLQKYLHEGASPRFEAFMKHDINKVLNLF